MKYAFLALSLVFFAGCGAFTNKDVASDVAVDDGRAVNETEGENYALENIFEGEEAATPGNDTEVIIIEEEAGMSQQDIDIMDSLKATTDAAVESSVVIKRESPVTGPAIPEEEMRALLNAELIANGQDPRF